jgi:GH15 family glucan-1,4-alpha-glucosidase
MAGFADTVAARWREPDAGIWEVRTRAAHHVHSKLMAWLCLD